MNTCILSYGLKRFYLLLFHSFLVLAVFGQNIEELQSLKSSISSSEDDTSKVSLLMNIAEISIKNDKYEAINYSKQAYELSLTLEDDKYICKSVLQYANVLYRACLYDSVLSVLSEMEDLFMACNDSLSLATLYFIEGSACRQLSKLDKAIELFQKAIGYFGPRKNKLKGDAYTRLGISYKYYGEYDSTIVNYLFAREIFDELNDTAGITKTLINIGKVYFEMEEYNNALNYYQEAQELLKKKTNLAYETINTTNLGMVYSKLKDYETALEYYKKAYELADVTNLEIEKGDIINNIGDIYLKQGLNDKALGQFEKALAIFKKNNYVTGELSSRNNIAVIYELKNDYIKALAILDTAMQIAKKNKVIQSEIHSYHGIAFYNYQLGHYQKGFDALKKWAYMKDSTINIEKAENIARLTLKYEKEKNESEILALQNEALQKDLEIKQRTNQRNIISGSGTAAIVIIILLFFIHNQRNRKDRIIKEKEILRLKEEKKVLAAKSIVEGQEEERKRIALELHDGLGVMLSNVKMQFTSYMDTTTSDNKLLKRAASVLDQASVDVRRISHNMMPGNLNRFGLVAAIEDLFEEINEAGIINAEMKNNLADKRFPENTEIMLYRIIQELLNNTIKHAGATSISLNIKKHDNNILFRYADNGSGFDIKQLNLDNSLGIASIRSRVEFLGGELSIETNPGKGTSFEFEFTVN